MMRNIFPFVLPAAIWLSCTGPGGERSGTTGAELERKQESKEVKKLFPQLAGCRRVVFLGDSITYSGQYVDAIELAWRKLFPETGIEFLDLGLPSETVSGLTEPGHAGGAFPRPDLHDRLERLLAMTHPDLVLACYGMNDGIYYPFGVERFQRYQEGIRLLRQRVTKSGARLILITPPVFDPVPIRERTLPAGRAEYPQPFEGYNDVLDRYSEWLLGQRSKGWPVIDVHFTMNRFLAAQRQKNPAFILAPDGVHLNDTGHWIIAQEILRGLGMPKNLEVKDLFSTEQGREVMGLIHKRNRSLSDSWLTAVGHKRPGMEKGLPLAEAAEQAATLDAKIKERIRSVEPGWRLTHFEAPRVDLRPRLFKTNGTYSVELWSGPGLVGLAPESSPAGIRVRRNGGKLEPVLFTTQQHSGHSTVLGPVQMGELTLKLRLTRLNPSLIERVLEVTSRVPQKFAVSFDFLPAAREGIFETFSEAVARPIVYDTLGGGPEYPSVPGQTFPLAAYRAGGAVVGLIGDSPANWENRCLVEINPQERRLAVMNGDGREPYELRIQYDAKDRYKCQLDGYQSIDAGETRRYVSWLFADRATTHYETQLAAHLALANAKHWNHSALEAILRNTSYLLCRRNLMREESRYLFISGIGYGWKQWVSDGFWMAVGLGDKEKLVESYRAVFENRVTYEDNAQYYLIWSVLVKRAGGQVNWPLARVACDFIRGHETNGVFFPPPLAGAPSNKGWKTYMDVLEYDDDDAPVSNQGFHCGALMAARELGFPVKERDIDRAIAGYQRMFNQTGGYFPTSVKKTNQIGQDTLYGAALTYAVFGRKILDDASVQAHLRTSARVQSPYGFRVISQADGSLLPNHNGSYVYGGSWFLCDAANYLLGEIHGLSTAEINQDLIGRIEKELAWVPAFNESISTVTGKPHGHVLYSWNSGYGWLRQEFRKHRHEKAPDPVGVAIDARLGVVHDEHGLRLGPAANTIRPAGQGI